MDDTDAKKAATAKKPWITPKVILSDPMSGVAALHNNKGTNSTPDNRASLLTSTFTS